MKRQLVAILYADVAGYSRLTGENEEQTHRQLDEGLNLLADAIASHDGLKVHEAGDAILAEFPSVTDAVEAAVESQKAMATRNTDLAEDERVRFRMGINLGEVIHDRGDIYGDGVNIAARIQEIAPIGGLFVSSSVYEQLTKSTDYGFDDLGYRDFKNIERPVHVYQMRYSDLLDSHPMQDIAARVVHQPLFGDVLESKVVTSGRCICGSIKFDITQESLGSGYCHCRICQRSTGAPVNAWTAFPADAVKFTRGKLKYYRLSLIAEQGFCGNCGTPVAWRSLKPEVAKFLVMATTSLDNPEDFAPSWHGCVESQLPWLQIHDDLPRMRAEEAPMLKKAWESAGVDDPVDWKELTYEESIALDKEAPGELPN
jgi:class 3 adenylate cyclase